MKTVWLLISPVSLFMNSAVTNRGAAYVTSRSLHSSTEFLGGSKRWSRKESDMVPEKSSIGEISSKISSRPDLVLTSVRPSARASSTRSRQAAFPTSQSKESICRSRRSGTSMGSAILAKEIRPVVETAGLSRAVREAANSGSFRDSQYLVVALRMTNGPCQVETGRRNGEGKPQQYAEGRAKSRTRRTA